MTAALTPMPEDFLFFAPDIWPQRHGTNWGLLPLGYTHVRSWMNGARHSTHIFAHPQQTDLHVEIAIPLPLGRPGVYTNTDPDGPDTLGRVTLFYARKEGQLPARTRPVFASWFQTEPELLKALHAVHAHMNDLEGTRITHMLLNGLPLPQ